MKRIIFTAAVALAATVGAASAAAHPGAPYWPAWFAKDRLLTKRLVDPYEVEYWKEWVPIAKRECNKSNGDPDTCKGVAQMKANVRNAEAGTQLKGSSSCRQPG